MSIDIFKPAHTTLRVSPTPICDVYARIGPAQRERRTTMSPALLTAVRAWWAAMAPRKVAVSSAQTLTLLAAGRFHPHNTALIGQDGLVRVVATICAWHALFQVMRAGNHLEDLITSVLVHVTIVRGSSGTTSTTASSLCIFRHGYLRGAHFGMVGVARLD